MFTSLNILLQGSKKVRYATIFAQLQMKHGQVMAVHILETDEKLKFICDGKFDSPSDRIKPSFAVAQIAEESEMVLELCTWILPEIMVA